jgi:hypothetical protein
MSETSEEIKKFPKVIKIKPVKIEKVSPKPEGPILHLLKNYTPKSFVVYGDTKPHMESLKALQGTFNRGLTHPETKEKIVGYVFSNKHFYEVKRLVAKINGEEVDDEDLEMQTISYQVVLPVVGYSVVAKPEGSEEDVKVKISDTFKDSEGRTVSFNGKGQKTYTFELVNGNWTMDGKNLVKIHFSSK